LSLQIALHVGRHDQPDPAGDKSGRNVDESDTDNDKDEPDDGDDGVDQRWTGQSKSEPKPAQYPSGRVDEEFHRNPEQSVHSHLTAIPSTSPEG
jgi:hypothetical protein